MALVVALVIILLNRGGGESPEETLEKLQARTALWASSQAKVTYVMSTTTLQGTDLSRWVLYWRPPDWRLDFSGSSGSQKAEGSVIVAGGETYSCEVKGGSGQCQRAGSKGNPVLLLPFPFLEFIRSPDGFDRAIQAITKAGGEFDRQGVAIGGEKGDCFFFFGGVDVPNRTDWCFAADGALLSISNKVESSVRPFEARLEATSVTRAVGDADFQPPFPVVEAAAPAPSPTPAPSPAPTPSPTP